MCQLPGSVPIDRKIPGIGPVLNRDVRPRAELDALWLSAGLCGEREERKEHSPSGKETEQ
jgi:hypothetical protein